MSKAKKIIIPVVAVLVVAGLLIFYFLSRRIPSNGPAARGNTSSNLINGGTFCEYKGKIYFSNPYDNGRLYTMDPDCNHIERISTDSVSYINACGKYLYFVRNNSSNIEGNSVIFRGLTYGIVRTSLDGSNEKTLFDEYCTDLSLVGDTLVFNANNRSVLSTFTLATNQKEPAMIYGDNLSNGSLGYDEVSKTHYLYHSNHDGNHSVYVLNLESGNRVLYLQGNTYMATEYNGSIYYIDLDNDYALTCVNVAAGTKTVLTKDRVVLFNIYDNVILYQTENAKDHHALKRMAIDGSRSEEVMVGDITSISCTSQYTFVTLYDAPGMLYRLPTYQGSNVESFYITYN